MDEQEIRKAIAEFMGFDPKKITEEDENGPEWVYVDITPPGAWAIVPDYLHDLNAMHEVEQELERRGREWIGRYLTQLLPIIGRGEGPDKPFRWKIAHATAERRARAAYAVISQQKEGK